MSTKSNSTTSSSLTSNHLNIPQQHHPYTSHVPYQDSSLLPTPRIMAMPLPPIPVKAQCPSPDQSDSTKPKRICGCLDILPVFLLILLFASVFSFFALQTLQLQQRELEDVFEEFKRIQTNEGRRLFIKSMARDAWKAYAQFAWGQDALEPETRSANQEWLGPNGGLTLIQAMSTLHIMGFRDEFERAKSWVTHQFNFSAIDQQVNVFVTVTEIIGSLLSNFALTQERIFIEKALEIARIIAPAYDTVDGLPYKKINPTSGTPSGPEVWLGEAGGQWLEYRFLANLTRDQDLVNRIEQIREFFERIQKPKGLFLAAIDSTTGEWASDRATLFAAGSTFYSYLMKAYIQSGGRDFDSLRMYQEAIQAAERNLLIHNSQGGLVYVRDHNSWTGEYGEFMRHDSCYLGAMLALGADAQRNTRHLNLNFSEARMQQQRAVRHFRMAQNITETCHLASVMSRTGLPPAHLFFREIEPTPDMAYNRYYLTSELAESYFVLWRLTHENKYREYAWKLVESLYRHAHCPLSGGFSNIDDVDQVPTVKTNYQPPQFLGATLKYLFLTFADDSLLPLDEWIFNRAGQPLPICGAQASFPLAWCR